MFLIMYAHFGNIEAFLHVATHSYPYNVSVYRQSLTTIIFKSTVVKNKNLVNFYIANSELSWLI